MKTITRRLITSAIAFSTVPVFAQGMDQRSSVMESGKLAKIQLGEDLRPEDRQGQIRTAESSREYEDRRRRSIEEIIVTAQKREERLQDVPISISVLGGGDLDSATVSSVSQALMRVPGVHVDEIPTGGTSQVAVRGVAASQASFQGPSPTAYYLDSIPFGFVSHAFGPDPDAYDLDRVEVLRGPQGTLYGASALNGVVRVLTKNANPDEFEMKARASSSSTRGGDWNHRGDLAINVPLIEGKLAARAAVGYQDWSGWIDKPNDKNANDSQRSNLRLKIDALPTEQLSIGLSAWSSRTDAGSLSTADESERNSSLMREPIVTDYDAYGAKIGYELPWASVTSMTSYIDFTNDFVLDFIPGPPSGFFEINLAAETFAQEVLITSTHAGDWRWSLGGMYRDAKDMYYQNILGIYVAPTRIRNFSESKAVFGELTRLFLNGKLELTGGLRYFEDTVSQRELSRLTGVTADQLIATENTFDATTPRVALTWHPNDQMTVYGSYSEGFRSGTNQGTPAILVVAPDFIPTKPDTLKNYEVGVKGSLWSGRLNLDTAVYYIDWQDMQVQVLVRVPVGAGFRDLGALINGNSASGVGFDFGVTAQPVDGLQLGLNFNWNDLAMDSDVLSGGVVLFEKGDRPSRSVEYTVGGSLDYIVPLGSGGYEAQFSASANYTSEQTSRTIGAGVRRISTSDAIVLANTSVSIRSPNHWTGTLFVDNVNNEQDSPYPYLRGGLSPADSVMRLRPRTVGLQLEYQF